MKNNFALAAAMLLCLTASAKIWRVNNNAGVVADFTTVQAAHDNANVNAGDTLHIEPSITTYGSLVMTKRLTLISIGEFLSHTPSAQYSANTGTIDNININDVNASGSVFHCNLSGSFSVGNANNLRIGRCRIASGLFLNTSNNNAVLNSYIYVMDLTASTSNVVSNNIFSWTVNINPNAGAVVTHNVFCAEFGNDQQVMYNSTFQNNIINKAGGFTFTNSIVQNNLAADASLPAGNGNQNNVVMASVFVNPSGNYDAAFVLKTGAPNPAVGAGLAGVDCGAFGGASPFKLALQPAVPAIYKLIVPAAPTGNSMNVTFSTRSNN